MGSVFRLTDENERRLKKIDENPHKAMTILLDNYVSHEDIISKLEDIEEQIKNLKS